MWTKALTELIFVQPYILGKVHTFQYWKAFLKMDSNCINQLVVFELLTSSQKFWFESKKNKSFFVSWATNLLNPHKYVQCFRFDCCFPYFSIQKTFRIFFFIFFIHVCRCLLLLACGPSLPSGTMI